MTAAPSPAAALDTVDFCFLSRDEVRAISVRRIENENTFDSLLNPVPGGLYDTALGSWGDSPCATCTLKTNCPGHPGHIELLVPLYHPIFMDQAFRLLRAQCMHCHGFRMSPRALNLVACKLRLLRFGLVREANLVAAVGDPSYGIGELDVPDDKELEVEEEGKMSSTDPVCILRDQYVRRVIREHVESGAHRTTAKHEGVGDARRQVIKDFMADAPAARKCHCGGISPSYRKNGWVKVFEMALSPKDKQAMAQRNMKLVDAMARGAKAKAMAAQADEGVADMDVDGGSDDDDEIEQPKGKAAAASAATSSGSQQRYIDSMEVRGRLQLLFDKEQDLLSLLYRAKPPTRSTPPISPDMFFMQTLLVPPNRYRPEAKQADTISEAQQNNLYKNILRHNNEIARHFRNRSAASDGAQRARIEAQLHQAWVDLQGAVNALVDSTKNPVQGAAAKRNEEGIKQKLEKKEGLFRMNMMGKRVNYAARSVISPDPNLETNEIGVPPVFASKLTYPEPVTTHNFRDMQQAVINGPHKWPGASAVEMENGRLVSLRHKSAEERVALANQLLTPSSVRSAGAKNKRVYRHLTNGDVVLMNRQPSLHRPSIMGHRVRVLPGEKTLRMHYANCNTYNADFDGDEMNMHFPQNELARVEALQVADTDHQYISTTQGAPLRGLIQDHISVAVDLCSKDSFFDRAAYNQLVYSALRPENGHTTSDRLILLEPAVLRPAKRWTGKQVITTILRNIQPPECGGVWMSAPTKIPAGEWGPSGSEEGLVEFQDGYFVTGILDKSHIGPSSGGLVHAVHEVYGPTIAGKLLSSLGRLLTRHLNTRAFSCGMDDLRLTPHGEARRRELLTAAGRVGLETAAGYVSLADRPDDPELRVRLEEVMRDDGKQAGLDRLMNSACDKVKDSVNKELMPGGLVKKFPTNRMQTMTVSGAKGSKVNATLISCSLGQQVLEGRRVPLMVSGKSLPCFDAFETHARAGGFVVNRFLTGIRPQEYYFHTMTGREGLIDTAVKTSRSGYLQRCLIKGMEGLTVSYDSTVRDSDGSMVQFLFGEDGIDVAKTKYLDDFSFVLRNWRSGSAQLKLGPEVFDLLSENREGITKHQRSAIKHARAAKESGGGGSALSLAGLKDPANSLVNPARFAFATSERFFDAMTAYMKANPDGLVREKGGRDSVIRAGATAAASSSPNAFQIPKKMAESLLAIKYVRGQVEPGEAVGIVAGQSVGEPSTQMTLNTFHLAGHSGKNVTLGIPRLREILMTARRTIATPSMTLRLRPGVSDAAAERFAKSISVLPLANLLDSAHVRERVGAGINAKGAVCRMYDVSLNLFPSDEYGAMYGATAAEVMRAIETRFMPNLTATVRREIKKRKATAAAAVATAAAPEIGVSVGTIEVAAGGGDPDRAAAAAGMDDEGGDDDDDDSDGENDATGAKQKSKRTEAVSYGPNDDDDDAIMRANQREVDVDGDDDEGLGRDDAEEARSSDGEEGDNTDDEAVALMRGLRVTQKFSEVTRFAADEAGGAWARFTLEFDLAATPKILLLNMVQKAVRATLVHEVPGIKTCTFTPAQEIMGHAEPASITVDGINFAAIHEHAQSAAAASSSSMDDDDDDQAPLAIVDADSIQTNDIYAVLCTYGVEACRGAIVAELAGVFSSHGITVDNRHLNLIADYMTRGGRFEPFNRLGLKGNASPFSKMSFETTVGFLKDAVLDGDWDELRNPSSQLVMGTLARVGTGTFDVVPPAKGVEVAA